MRFLFLCKFIGLFYKIASFAEGGERCESACRTSALAALLELGGTPASINLLFFHGYPFIRAHSLRLNLALPKVLARSLTGRKTWHDGQPSAAPCPGIFRADHSTPVMDPELITSVTPLEFRTVLRRVVYVMCLLFTRE